MSNSPNIIDISSNSSSKEATDMASKSSSEQLGWANYFPPYASSSSTMKSTKKRSTPAPSLEFYSSSSSDDDNDPSFTLSKELPKALTAALESAMMNMKWPAPEKPARLLRPPKQVLGLACPRKQLSFDNKRKTASKSKHDYEGKGKKPME